MFAHPFFALLLTTALLILSGEMPLAPDSTRDTVVIDNFESYARDEPPTQWKFITSSEEVLSIERMNSENERFFVVAENGNKFVRAYTKNEAQRITQRNGAEFDWNVETHPRLQWEWRALKLPEGASEKEKNDTGGAVYVTFGRDWLGRPKSIKYSYSSSLPVGTVVSFGPLRVIVVDSKNEPHTGQWKTVQRNVFDDYRQVFGGRPPDRPLSITLWSDSDTTGSEAMVDFDNITLLPPYRR